MSYKSHSVRPIRTNSKMFLRHQPSLNLLLRTRCSASPVSVSQVVSISGNLGATKFDRWEANTGIREVKVKARRDRKGQEGLEGTRRGSEGLGGNGRRNTQSHVTGNATAKIDSRDTSADILFSLIPGDFDEIYIT